MAAVLVAALVIVLGACASSPADEPGDAQALQATETDPGASAEGGSESCPRPYAASSAWNTPIGASAVYDPDSAAYVARIEGQLTSDPSQFTFPVYEVSSDTPLQPVQLSGWFSDVTGDGRLMENTEAITVEIPVPVDAEPAAGEDAQIVIVNVDTGEEWGAYRFGASESGGYTAENAYHYDLDWDAVPPPSTGGGAFVSRGAGLPYLAGLVRRCEIDEGRIGHALAFAYDAPAPDYVYPATKSDGAGEVGLDLPEGARLQLDPELTEEELADVGCTGPCLTVAHAMQEYGMFVIDNSGRAKIMIEFEGTAGWGDGLTESTVSPIPLDRLRVLDTRAVPADAGCTVSGTDGDDELIGTRSADVICGFAGNDSIQGMEGNDVIYGGDGDDSIVGGEGHDAIDAGGGDDWVLGDAGRDVIVGGVGADVLGGGGDADRIIADDGEEDIVDGGAGDDELRLDDSDTDREESG
ncbi:MAG: calcium-binding protein [Gaiellaceae bacterium]